MKEETKDKLKKKWEAYKEKVKERQIEQQRKRAEYRTERLICYGCVALIVILVLIFGWQYIVMFLMLLSGGV